jgi:TadE-like protein
MPTTRTAPTPPPQATPVPACGGLWRRLAARIRPVRRRPDAGMTTAEYAVGHARRRRLRRPRAQGAHLADHPGCADRPDRAGPPVRTGPGDRLRRVGRGRSPGRERGSATAELAVALPALVLVLLFALGAVDAVLARLRCIDAARDAALTAARGGDGTAAGSRGAPPGATVTVTRDGDIVRARVRVRVAPLGPHLPGVTVEGDAATEVEPGAVPGPGESP